jgi:hypothetical protein
MKHFLIKVFFDKYKDTLMILNRNCGRDIYGEQKILETTLCISLNLSARFQVAGAPLNRV